jgi:protein-S-isoprenylcysteine O-methyltransferase Ste14
MTTEELQLRRWVVFASGLIYWAGVLIQVLRIRQKIGRSPNLRPRSQKEKALWFGWFMVVLAWIGQPWLVGAKVTNPGLAFLPALVNPGGFALGLLLVVLGYAGTLWAYVVMGNAWRIGINATETTVFVRRGPYRWVRHPIYLFQIVMLAGAALLLPTVFSFAILAVHYICVLIKAADEEKYLKTVHGDAYRGYLCRTGGLFPRWIRRRSATENKDAPGIDS